MAKKKTTKKAAKPQKEKERERAEAISPTDVAVFFDKAKGSNDEKLEATIEQFQETNPNFNRTQALIKLQLENGRKWVEALGLSSKRGRRRGTLDTKLQDLLVLLNNGASNKEIAEELETSAITVGNTIKRLTEQGKLQKVWIDPRKQEVSRKAE